jgi:hypothetical protein
VAVGGERAEEEGILVNFLPSIAGAPAIQGEQEEKRKNGRGLDLCLKVLAHYQIQYNQRPTAIASADNELS